MNADVGRAQEFAAVVVGPRHAFTVRRAGGQVIIDLHLHLPPSVLGRSTE